jgi:hypothetical protein
MMRRPRSPSRRLRTHLDAATTMHRVSSAYHVEVRGVATQMLVEPFSQRRGVTKNSAATTSATLSAISDGSA